ncbi:MAG: PASTA domain-containing protein, partial [Acidimicrobiia bacterium]
PKPTVVNPDVPVALENIVLTAMAKNPEARYASADDMRADLARFRRGEQTSAVPLTAVPVTGADVTVVNPQMDKVYDRTTVGTVVPSQAIPTAPRRSAAPFVLVLVALLGVLLGLGYLLARQLSDDGGGGALITVGNYVGKTEEVARELIEDDKLVAEITTEENEQVPVGQVFAQDPPEGNKLEEGGAVRLRVSGGKGQVRVPDVAGESLDDAQARLSDAGFQYRVRQETSDSVDPSKVIRTDPASGALADKGSVVDLYVSLGKERVEVPNVAGQDPVEAANALGAKGLTVERVEQASDTVEDGTVIGTNPPAGTAVEKNSKVQLIISTGKEQVRVPNVVGLSRSDATTELENAGFQVTVREVTSLDPSNAGRVIAQSPSADSKADKGSIVTITVGKFGGTTSTTSSSSFP